MPGSIPQHRHGSSKYYYDQGCTDPLCKAVAAAAKAANRARRRSERTRVGDHWEHPDLKPFDSDSPRRHGTKYARTTFGCECEHCKPRPDLVAFPGSSLLWAGHVDGRIVGLLVAAVVVVLLWRFAPVDVQALAHAIHLPRVSTVRIGLVALTAYTAAPLVAFVVVALVVANTWSIIHRERTPA